MSKASEMNRLYAASNCGRRSGLSYLAWVPPLVRQHRDGVITASGVVILAAITIAYLCLQ